MIRLFRAEEGETLMEVMRRANVGLNAPCGGNHSCGKCRVQVMDGMKCPIGADEIRLLSEAELAAGWRLPAHCKGPENGRFACRNRI